MSNAPVLSSQPRVETSPLPWYPEPDERDGYEWNIHIVERDRPNMRICFMSVAPNSEANAYLIIDAVNNYARLTDQAATLKARVEELEGRHREACKEIDELKYLARFIHQQTIVPNNNGEITAWAALLYARLTVIHNATVRS